MRIAVFLVLMLWLGMCLGAPAAEQIPCWKVEAVLAFVLGNEAKAEKIARKYYSRAQIEEAKKRCRP